MSDLIKPYVETELPNGRPLFIVDDEKAIEEIDKLGHNIYFILAAAKKDNGKTGIQKEQTKEVRLFKRTQGNAVGHGITEQVDASRMTLATFENKVFCDLPKIPNALIDQMDALFRRVDKENHSESIVLLGFDPKYHLAETEEEKMKGWCFVIPEQKNSSTSCKYEPGSWEERKPDGVQLVGSAHSHPGMSAYASHTDEGDQTDFDGIHITFGWQSKHRNVTEFHVEFVFNNQTYKMDPDAIFEDFTPTQPFEVPDEWLEVIDVARPTGPTRYTGGNQGTSSSGPSGGGSTTGTHSKSPSSQFIEHWRNEYNKNRPKTCPDLVKNTVITTVTTKATKCPVCGEHLTAWAHQTRRCVDCFTYLRYSGEKVSDVITARAKAFGNRPYAPGLEGITGKKSPKAIVLWDSLNENDPVTVIKEAGAASTASTGEKKTTAAAAKPSINSLRFGTSIDCPKCQGVILWGSINCSHCHDWIGKPFWDELERRSTPAGPTTEELFSSNAGKSRAEGKAEGEIKGAVHGFIRPPAISPDSIYTDPECSKCIKQFTKDCEDWGLWISKFDSGKIPDEIASTCEDFELDIMFASEPF